MTPVRLGIVGCGRVTSETHLPALRGVAELDVVAVADVREEAAARVAREFQVPRWHASPEELVADPAVEAVAVCVPVGAHREVASLALAARTPVFVEKPLALTLADADALVAAADAAGVPAMIGFNLRGHPLVREVRELVASGALGTPRTIATVLGANPIRPEDVSGWRLDPAAGGGGVFENAIHSVDLWRHLLDDEVAEVFSWSESRDTGDDAGVAAARMRSGALASTTYTYASPSHRLELLGTGGQLTLDLMRPDGLDYRPRSAPGRRWGWRERIRARLAELAPRGRGHLPPPGGMHRVSYQAQWRQFAECARSGTRPRPDLAEGRATLEVVLALRMAAESRRPITLPLPV